MKCKGVVFSPKYTRGSQAARKQTVKSLGDKIYTGIIDLFDAERKVNIKAKKNTKQEFISVRQLGILFKALLPENLNITIKKLEKGKLDHDGIILTNCNQNGVYGYIIKVLAKNNNFEIKNVPIFMHEVTHLLDFAVNPKHNTVFKNLRNNAANFDVVNKLYDDFYYTFEDYSKFRIMRETKKALKDMTAEDKILALRYLKLSLETEENAYTATKTFSDKLGRIRVNVKGYKGPFASDFNFKMKIKLLDRMRYKIIKQEHNKIKQSL